jgi:protein-S-isoprenylcysteine O-methyltransferase Ste14
MHGPTWIFILCCWGAWLTYWVVMAFSTKRTVEHGGFIGFRLVMVVVAAALIVVAKLAGVSPQSVFWRTPLALGVVSDCIVVVGVAILVWARVTLGRNWSAEVTFKEDHELIESGPYALVRHPIYSGLIVMAVSWLCPDRGTRRQLLVEGPGRGADHQPPLPRRLRRVPQARPRDHPVRAVSPTSLRVGSGAGLPGRRADPVADDLDHPLADRVVLA